MAVPLVASADDLDAIVLEAAPGEIVEDAQLTDDERHAAYQMVGAFAAALHTLPCDGCGVDARYEEAALASVERWLPDPAAGFNEDVQQWARDAVRANGAWRDVELVPAHMDYSPRNWLLHRDDGALWLHVSRFGAGPSCAVGRGMCSGWRRTTGTATRASARRSSSATDGSRRSWEERQIPALVVSNNAIGAIAWGGQRGDAAFVAKGRAILERLRAEG